MLARDEREAAARGEGCLGKAADDEILFVLRAQDRFAPQLVEHWAHLVVQAGGAASEAKAAAAAVLAEDMRNWQARTQRAKVPD